MTSIIYVTKITEKFLNVDRIQHFGDYIAIKCHAIRYVVTRSYVTTFAHGHFVGNEIDFELVSWELAIEYFSSREKSRFYHH